MRLYHLSPTEWGKTVAIGIGVAVVTAGFMMGAKQFGVSPLPKPLGPAFADTLFGAKLPLPVGLVFHLAWVMFFSAVYVVLFREALTFARAFWLAFALWVLVLIAFFPFVGWGVLGLAISPKLIVASAVPHLLFAVTLWGLCRLAFDQEQQASVQRRSYGIPAR